MIAFPKSVDEALAATGTFRAGATDLQERRHHHIDTGPLVDLRDVVALDAIEDAPGGGLLIGALVPIAALAEDPRTRDIRVVIATTNNQLASLSAGVDRLLKPYDASALRAKVEERLQ